MTFKTKEELLAEYLNYPYNDEFMLLLRSDILQPLSSINGAASLLAEMIDDETIDRDGMRKLAHMIIQNTDGLRNLMDAVVEYDKIRRKKDQNPSQENPGDSN